MTRTSHSSATVPHIAVPHWRRKSGSWQLVIAGRILAHLERAGDGWLLYIRDDAGEPWFAGVAGKLPRARALLEAWWLRQAARRAFLSPCLAPL